MGVADVIHLDMETRSELDVTEVGPHKYSQHPSTDILCLRYAIGDGPTYLWHRWAVNSNIPNRLREALKVGYKLKAHNKMFEECIWKNILVKKYNWPHLDYDYGMECSAAEAAYMALPRSLEKLGSALKLNKQKDLAGKRTMLKCSKPRRPTKQDPTSKWHEDPKDLNIVFAYNEDDVLCEREACDTLLPLSDFEKRIWRLDQKINRKGVYIDKDGVEAALYLISQYTEKLNKEIFEITDGFVTSATKIKDIHEFIENEGVHLPNLQAQTIQEFLDSKEAENTSARRVLEIRALLSKASTKKFQAMIDRMCDDGRVKDNLVYSGAGTHRFSGAGLQIQNLPAGRSVQNKELAIEIMKLRDLELFEACYSDVLKTISALVRGMICAPDGKVIRSVDYNAIEARVIFWLSNCKTGLEEFEENKPIYKLMAADVFEVPLEEVTEEMRDLGKRIVLGAGFGMGPDKFVITCYQQGGLVIEAGLAKKGIAKYRERYSEVPKFWKDLNSAALRCVLGKVGNTQVVGKLTFTLHDLYMTITLPSGSNLYYWYPSVKETVTSWGQTVEAVHFWYVESQTKRWVEGSAYGGLWAENVTQATARDVMAAAMLAVDEAGHEIIFSVHDEIDCEDSADFKSLKELEELMLKSKPEWAHGLPLVVKGWEAERYKK